MAPQPTENDGSLDPGAEVVAGTITHIIPSQPPALANDCNEAIHDKPNNRDWNESIGDREGAPLFPSILNVSVPICGKLLATRCAICTGNAFGGYAALVFQNNSGFHILHYPTSDPQTSYDTPEECQDNSNFVPAIQSHVPQNLSRLFRLPREVVQLLWHTSAESNRCRPASSCRSTRFDGHCCAQW